jgi:hypothetical protein
MSKGAVAKHPAAPRTRVLRIMETRVPRIFDTLLCVSVREAYSRAVGQLIMERRPARTTAFRP